MKHKLKSLPLLPIAGVTEVHRNTQLTPGEENGSGNQGDLEPQHGVICELKQ